MVSNRSNITALIAISSLYMASCAVNGIEIGMDGGSSGQAGTESPAGVSPAGVSSPVAGENGGTGGPPTGLTTPPLGGTDDRCTPGEKIDTCTICGPDASYIMPPDDPECEALNCSELSSFYEEVNEEDGSITCMQRRAVPVEGSCYRMGFCHATTNTACVVEEPIARATIYPGCGQITGCNSTNSPSFSEVPEGGLCHGFGTCQATGGPCDVSKACAGFERAAGGSQQTFCASSEISCTVSVNANVIDSLDEISCLAYCASASKSCRTAYQYAENCNTSGNAIPCNQAAQRVICECED